MKLIFVGDIFPANLPYNRGLGVAATFYKNANKVYYINKLKALFNGADFVIGNLESPILSENKFSIESQFAGHIDFIHMLKACGVKIVSIANNHILEYGDDGFLSTKKILTETEILYVGESRIDSLSNIEVVQYDGLKMGFVAYNDIDKQINTSKLYSCYSKEKVLTSIYEMNKLGIDYKFIFLHWGDEYVHCPSVQQIQDAHAFIDAGANFIIGSHPHVVQPVEKYRNGLICYSLGNFIFDMTYNRDVKSGLMINVNLSKNEFDYEIKHTVIEKDFFPIVGPSEKMDNLLSRELQKTIKYLHDEKKYQKRYIILKKYKRLWSRFLSKRMLIWNWRRFSPLVRRNFIEYYKSLMFK